MFNQVTSLGTYLLVSYTQTFSNIVIRNDGTQDGILSYDLVNL